MQDSLVRLECTILPCTRLSAPYNRLAPFQDKFRRDRYVKRIYCTLDVSLFSKLTSTHYPNQLVLSTAKPQRWECSSCPSSLDQLWEVQLPSSALLLASLPLQSAAASPSCGQRPSERCVPVACSRRTLRLVLCLEMYNTLSFAMHAGFFQVVQDDV